jgi:hypothetical protein
MMLARLARMDPTLLHPVKHGSQEAQQDMLQLKLRDSLVRARVALINAVRFSLKSLGYAVSNPSSERSGLLGAVRPQTPHALAAAGVRGELLTQPRTDDSARLRSKHGS